MALKAFAQQVLRIHILMFLHGSVLHGSPFIQRAIETKRRDFFSSSQPSSGLAVKASGEPIFQLPLEGCKASLAWQHRAPCSWSSSLHTGKGREEATGHTLSYAKIMNIFTDETLVVHSLTEMRGSDPWANTDLPTAARTATAPSSSQKSRGILDRCILPLAPEAPLSKYWGHYLESSLFRYWMVLLIQSCHGEPVFSCKLPPPAIALPSLIFKWLTANNDPFPSSLAHVTVFSKCLQGAAFFFRCLQNSTVTATLFIKNSD